MDEGQHAAVKSRRRALSVVGVSAPVCALLLVFQSHSGCHGLNPHQTAAAPQHATCRTAEEHASCIETKAPVFDGRDPFPFHTTRRKLFGAAVSAAVAQSSPPLAIAAFASTSTPTAGSNPGSIGHPFVYSDSWTGTNLRIRSLRDALPIERPENTNGAGFGVWEMGRWPDPSLRVRASPIDLSLWLSSPENRRGLVLAAGILRETALLEGAVGLAAQQCGVDAAMVFLSGDSGSRTDGTTHSSRQRTADDLVLINPRIVARSPESNMKVWTEECLVLPPTFRATVLRDEWIDVESDLSFAYRSGDDLASGGPKTAGTRMRFFGEQSRCLQHELDHDRGILITDHVGLEELENDLMRRIEAEGHDRRQALAYSRQ